MGKKKYFIHTFLQVLCALAASAFLQASFSPEEEAIIKKQAAPQWMVDALSNDIDFFQKISECIEISGVSACRKKHRHLVWSLPSLPGYYIKALIERIIGAEKVRDYIARNNLDKIVVPKKFLYHIPGKSTELRDENYLVIAESMEPLYPRDTLVLTLEEVQQICTVAKETGIPDIARENIVRRKVDNKLAFIDTEGDFDVSPASIYCSTIINFIFGSTPFVPTINLTEDASRYIYQQLFECRPQDPSAYKSFYDALLQKVSKRKHSSYLTFFKETFPEPAQ
jgi:hypothetical protein